MIHKQKASTCCLGGFFARVPLAVIQMNGECGVHTYVKAISPFADKCRSPLEKLRRSFDFRLHGCCCNLYPPLGKWTLSVFTPGGALRISSSRRSNISPLM